MREVYVVFFFFFNDTATTEIYTLSLHDALPISKGEDLLARAELDSAIILSTQAHDSIILLASRIEIGRAHV